MTKSVARTLVTPASPGGRPWRLAPDVLDRLETTMLDVLAELSGDDLPAASQSVRRGGKRLRPALTLAIASGDSVDERAAFRAASSVELLHRATLVHDDLLDGSARRHGTATVNARDGDAAALLTGDMLIAAAHVTAARCGTAAALTVAHTLADLCRGEALQAHQRFDATVTMSRMLAVARLKAGSLLRAAAELGGTVAGHDGPTVAALGRFGAEFGIALQLVDDLLDVVSDVETLGKPAGADFAGGTVTLPAIVAMQWHPELRALLRPDPDETSRRRALRLLRCPHAVRATRDAAYEHAELAARALRDLEPGFGDLARWPASYVEHQLSAIVTPADGCHEPTHAR